MKLQPGSKVALVGPSGGGKVILLKVEKSALTKGYVYVLLF